MSSSLYHFRWQDEALTELQRAEIMQESAQSAFRAGMQARAEGRHHAAWDWLERAYRLAPKNGHVIFALVLARQAVQDTENARLLLQDLLKLYDFQEGWILLYHFWVQRGYVAGAEYVLAHLFSTFAWTQELGQLANDYSSTHNRAWCGVTYPGHIQWGGVEPSIVPNVYYGNKKIRLFKKNKKWFLPEGWQREREIKVTFPGHKSVLGSPINGERITQCEGFVQEEKETLTGWVWCPNAPEINPIITLQTSDKKNSLQIVTSQKDLSFHSERPAAQYRTFSVPIGTLPEGFLHCIGPNGYDLMGSPSVMRQREKGAAYVAKFLSSDNITNQCYYNKENENILPFFPLLDLGKSSLKPDSVERKAPLAVVIPIYRHYAHTLACLQSVQKTLFGKAVKVVVVNDASPEMEMVNAVKLFCKKNNFIFINHEYNKGFPSSVNTGIRAIPGHDVILLNSDTLVPFGWAAELRKIAYQTATVGTVTPFSNKGGLLSYPLVKQENPIPTLPEIEQLMVMAHRANKGHAATLPTGNGFCLYIRYDCLKQTGFLREDIFAQGYGEENDFCLRAHALGWEHKAALGVYVGHVGAVSFGQNRLALMQRNEALLEQLHPGYHRKIELWINADPLWQARRRIDLVRFRAMGKSNAKAVLCVTHAHGGGVEHVVQQRVKYHQERGVRALVLRPTKKGCVLEDARHKKEFPSLIFNLPSEQTLLHKVLQLEGLQQVEVHHITGYVPSFYGFVHNIGVPYTIFIHDYAFFCQRVSLLGPHDTYCGEPALQQCVQCVALASVHTTGDKCTLEAYLTRSRRFLRAAQRVYTPSQDTAVKMARHFSGVRFIVCPPQEDKALPPLQPSVLAGGAKRAVLPGSGLLQTAQERSRVRLCVIGAIGREKGYEVLHQAALDAAWRDLPLEFVLVGHTPNDQLLLNTGRVYVTGQYKQEEALSLIHSFKAHAAFFPSIWPETWCLTLGLAWQAGLPAFVFDHGAPAERVRQTRRGWLLNSQLRGAALNQVLIKTVLGCKNSNDGKNQSPFIKL